MFAVMTTDHGTHSPDQWGEQVLCELVPIPEGATPEVTALAISIRSNLHVPVVKALKAVRDTEIALLGTLTRGEEHVLKGIISSMHGGPATEVPPDRMDQWSGKIRPSDAWEPYVQAIVRAAKMSPGDKVSDNVMTDRVYNVLAAYARNIQAVERSHRATSR